MGSMVHETWMLIDLESARTSPGTAKAPITARKQYKGVVNFFIATSSPVCLKYNIHY